MALASVGALFQLAVVVQQTLQLTGENQLRLRAVNNKVSRLLDVLTEAQDANTQLGVSDLDQLMQGLNAILEHSRRISNRMQNRGRLHKFFKADQVQAACSKLEREIDSELGMVTLACGLQNRVEAQRTQEALLVLNHEMREEFRLLQLQQSRRARRTGDELDGIGTDDAEPTLPRRHSAPKPVVAERGPGLARRRTAPGWEREELFRVGPREMRDGGESSEDELWDERRLPRPTATVPGTGTRGELVGDLWGDSDQEDSLM